MRDVIFLAVIVGFFALTALYVRWADRLVGVDDDLPRAGTDDADAEPALVETGVGR